MDGRKRTVQLKFRVTEAERDLILEKMKLIPTRNMAAYLRKIAIDGYIIQIDHSDIKAMTAEIQKIGVNVNQLLAGAESLNVVCICCALLLSLIHDYRISCSSLRDEENSQYAEYNQSDGQSPSGFLNDVGSFSHTHDLV